MQVHPTAFYTSWAVAGVILLVFAALLGRATGYGPVGILIDQRGRYSLNRLQLVLWTLLVLSTFLGLFFGLLFSVGFGGLNKKEVFDAVFNIPPNLLVLMGISVGSATTAGAVKSAKDASGKVQEAGVLPATATAAVAPPGTKVPPHFSQVFLQEEGSQIDNIIEVTKFQNFFFTIALAITYVVLVANLKSPGYPEFSDKVLWLLGVSHAGYIGGKMPTKA